MTATVDLKPFPVVHGKYLFWFTPEDVGFSVTCQNVPGVNAQGDTFEDALKDALSMAPFVEKCLAEIAAGKIARTPKKAAARRNRKTSEKAKR